MTLQHAWMRSSRRRGRGAAVVEMALVAPLFFALMFGIVQMGYLMYVRHLMIESARRTAREICPITKRTTAVTVGTNAAKQLLERGLPGASSRFDITINPAPATDDVTHAQFMIDIVTISSDYDRAARLPGLIRLPNFPMRVVYRVRHEGSRPTET